MEFQIKLKHFPPKLFGLIIYYDMMFGECDGKILTISVVRPTNK